MASSHKVLITGISSDIPKDTFISMLFDFGDMVTMFINDHDVSNGRKSGYVVYKTKLECFRAISGLNEQPPHYLNLQYGGIFKDEMHFEKQPEDSLSCSTPALNRAFQTQHAIIKYPHVIHRNSENCKHFVASEIVENKEVKICPSGRKKFGCKNYSSGILKNKGTGSATTDDQLNLQVRESEALLKQSYCIKESAFDRRPDKTKGKCLCCGRLGDESCEKCGASYCSRKCQMYDWSRHKQCIYRESDDVESGGAGTGMQMKDSASQNVETRLRGYPAQLRSQGTLYKENQGGDSDKLFIDVNMDAVVKEGRKAEAKERREKRSNKISPSRTGVIDRKRCTESDPVKKGEDMISLQSKYEVIESDNLNRISCVENLKGVCSTKARCSEMKRKHVHGIGRGVSVCKDWVTLESTSTVMVGNESDNISGAKSGSHFNEKSLDASSKFCDQGIEGQAYQEPERYESSASECISPLSRNLLKLISLNKQQKDEVQTFVEEPIRKKDMCSVKEDISSVKATTRNFSPLSENARKLEASDVQDRRNENEGDKKDMELQSGVLAKVQNLPPATEIVKAKTHQEVNGTAASSKESQWNLFSGDPKTHIVNYDLCTQQKKLSSEVFSKVNISSLISSGDYWVQSIDKSDLDVIQDMIINKKKTPEDPFKPCLGDYCCVFHNDMWYRAKVLFIKEMEILAALIDYGRILCVKAEFVQELPHVAKGFYAQAVHVKVDPRTPAECLNCEEGDVLAVKACGMMEEGITKVQLEGVLYAQEVVIPKQLSLAPLINENEGNEIPDTNKWVQWPPSVLSLLKTGDVMSCTVLNVLLSEEDHRDEMVVAIAFEDIANDLECIAADLPTDCMEQLGNSEFKPSIGDMVAAFSNEFNSWVRSIVLDAGCGHWLVACFDFGFIEEVTEIRDIPSDKKYRKSPALSVECLVTKSLFPREDLFCEGRIERNATLNAKVLKKKDDCLECEFGPNGDQTFCFVKLSVWSPKLNSSAYTTLNDGKLLPDPSLDIVQLTPGCSVKIVSYFESLVIYVQPCDAKSKLLMKELHDGIANFAVKNSPLKEVPVKGKKYICQYSGDMKYYRVFVKRIISPAKIHVYYIDYGNEETVTNKKLYELPPEFEKIPSFAVKIELKKEFNNVLSIDARKYLSNLILDNEELVLNYTDGNLKSAELLIHTHSLSDILKEFINS